MSTVKMNRAIKYGVTAAVALSAYGLDVKINKNEGFDIATQATSPSQVALDQISLNISLGISEASAKCGSAYNCSGGGGQCGSAYNCAGQ
jgi:hypothetical protein